MSRASGAPRAAGLALLALPWAPLLGAADEPAAPASRPARPERYVVVDADARQRGVEGLPGALFVYDRATNALSSLAADPRFADPQNAIVDDDGSLLVADLTAKPRGEGHGTGAVFRVDARTGAVLRVYTCPRFAAPTSLARGPGRALFVTDRHAEPRDGHQGAVFAMNLDDGACRVLAAGPPFRAPADLDWSRERGLVVLDADAKGAGERDEGALFEVDVVTGRVRRLAALAGTLSPLGLLREDGGGWLVFDANADPLRQGGPLGGVFRVDAAGETRLVASDVRFRDPVRGVRAADGSVLFVDANADPDRRGADAAGRGQNVTGPGALFRLEPSTGAVETLCSPAGLVNPVAIRRLP